MFGIMASVFRHATHTDSRLDSCDRGECLRDRRSNEARKRRKALDDLIRYRRGYW